MDCSICCEKLNNSTRKEICCVFCDYSVCRSCFQKYILQISLDPNCMNCKKTFDHEFISNNCTNVFVTTDLKKHRQNILFDREKALLIETQPYVVIENQKKALQSQISALYSQKYELRRQERALDADIHLLAREINTIRVYNVPEERKKFIRKCPIDNCRGFLSSQWKCGSCDKKICNKCNEEKIHDHECIPENVASMELINKDTKSCPNCGTLIFKINGCSMMFCTNCNTAWDWNTNCIVSGVIHNPHYYDFIRNGGGGGRNNADIPCGGLPEIHILRNSLNRVYGVGSQTPTYLYKIHQCITHIQHFELVIHVVENHIVTNRNLRIKYMMNEISENDLKTVLQQNEKKRQKTIAFNNIYEMFVNVGSDILRQIVVFFRENKRQSDCVEFINENIKITENLIIYFNENLKKIGKMYSCVYPGIATDTVFANNVETTNRRLITAV